VPFVTVNTWDTVAVPVTTGATVGPGTTAWAGFALMTANNGADSATAATMAIMRFILVKKFMGKHPSKMIKYTIARVGR
jgi:hypothetical protein